jgi:hypothetical protein
MNRFVHVGSPEVGSVGVDCAPSVSSMGTLGVTPKDDTMAHYDVKMLERCKGMVFGGK